MGAGRWGGVGGEREGGKDINFSTLIQSKHVAPACSKNSFAASNQTLCRAIKQTCGGPLIINHTNYLLPCSMEV